jgi:hypothetical protein
LLLSNGSQLVPLRQGEESTGALDRPVVGLYTFANPADPQLETARFQPLSLSSENPVSSLCIFKFQNLYRSAAGEPVVPEAHDVEAAAAVGLYTLSSVDPSRLKAPGFNPCTYKVKTRFQNFGFSNSTCTATLRSILMTVVLILINMAAGLRIVV